MEEKGRRKQAAGVFAGTNGKQPYEGRRGRGRAKRNAGKARRRVWSVQNRKLDDEGGALTRTGAFGADRAVMQFHQCLANC
jgi:hypothetical protein